MHHTGKMHVAPAINQADAWQHAVENVDFYENELDITVIEDDGSLRKVPSPLPHPPTHTRARMSPQNMTCMTLTRTRAHAQADARTCAS